MRFFDPLGSQWAQPKGPVSFGIEFGIGLSMVVVLLLIVFCCQSLMLS
ncbi:hypothetical protein ACP193_00725 [Spiroplasma endosymbiont of Glossina fuscipes fuscipes]